MAERRFQRGLYHLEPGLTLLVGTIVLGADGSVSSFALKGASGVTKTGTGAYRITLQDKYVNFIAGMAKFLKATSAAGLVPQLESVDVGGTKQIDILCVRPIAPAVTLHAVTAGTVSDPTTPSTQASGDDATVWRVDVAAALANLTESGAIVPDEVAADADRVLHDTTQLVANGQSVAAAIVAKVDSGVVSLHDVLGVAATTGEEVAPTQEEIGVSVTHANWAKLAETTINRTGDTTVSQSHDIGKKELCKVTNAIPGWAAADPVTATIEVILFLDNSSA